MRTHRDAARARGVDAEGLEVAVDDPPIELQEPTQRVWTPRFLIQMKVQLDRIERAEADNRRTLERIERLLRDRHEQ